MTNKSNPSQSQKAIENKIVNSSNQAIPRMAYESLVAHWNVLTVDEICFKGNFS